MRAMLILLVDCLPTALSQDPEFAILIEIGVWSTSYRRVKASLRC